ncbi:N-acetyltransferase [Haladaptatus sp. DYSN1]|uniref:GNAT family N-acetyltransferase n=1 Tax=unclassified Haladaptatus TaxID=2622732 RepID=UPI0024062031|nr:N-acetyltransferase [Haladaptatus sp. DYSN1]
MIREATKSDLPTLRAIQQASLDEPWPDLLSTADAGGPLILVAEDPAPVGYAVAISSSEATYLAELAVEPTARRNGYGTALLAAVLDRTNGRLELTVQESDEGAQKFYDSHSFAVEERLEDYYKSGDGLLLVRDSGE